MLFSGAEVGGVPPTFFIRKDYKVNLLPPHTTFWPPPMNCLRFFITRRALAVFGGLVFRSFFLFCLSLALFVHSDDPAIPSLSLLFIQRTRATYRSSLNSPPLLPPTFETFLYNPFGGPTFFLFRPLPHSLILRTKRPLRLELSPFFLRD